MAIENWHTHFPKIIIKPVCSTQIPFLKRWFSVKSNWNSSSNERKKTETMQHNSKTAEQHKNVYFCMPIQKWGQTQEFRWTNIFGNVKIRMQSCSEQFFDGFLLLLWCFDVVWHRWNSNATVPNWRLIAHKLNMMTFAEIDASRLMMSSSTFYQGTFILPDGAQFQYIHRYRYSIFNGICNEAVCIFFCFSSFQFFLRKNLWFNSCNSW